MSRATIIICILFISALSSCTIQPIGDNDNETDPIGAPDCPSGFAITLSTETSLSIHWNFSANSDGYYLYRSLSNTGSFSIIADVISPSTSYIDSPLAAETTYYYKIRAYNTYGESALSNLIAGTTQSASGSAPQVPSGLVVGSPTTTSLKISWNSVENTDGYRLYRSSSADGAYSLITEIDSSYTDHIDTSLDAGFIYYYKIEAYNSNGSSGLSSFAFGTTLSPPGDPPQTPTGLSAFNATTSSLTISWNASQGATGYILYNSLSSSGPFNTLYDGILTSVVNYNLPSNTTIYYKVSAYNENGTSPLSNSASGTTLAQVYPYFGGLVYADDGQFLGVINDNQFDVNSLANSFGTYGSTFSSYSIWNEFGTYGSSFSSLSAYNSFTSTPPVVYVNGVFYAYLTKNTIKFPRLDPNTVALVIGRSDVIR